MIWVARLLKAVTWVFPFVMMFSFMPNGLYYLIMSTFFRRASEASGFGLTDALAFFIFAGAVWLGLVAATRVRAVYRASPNGTCEIEELPTLALASYRFFLCLAVVISIWIGPLILYRIMNRFDSERTALTADQLESMMSR